MECDAMNPEGPSYQREVRQALSALMDGQGGEADLACRVWREDSGARADWHAYHLIGELMRSDDVRCAPRHDAQFFSGVRERLAAEPVVLAPAAAVAITPSAQRPRRRAWVAPAAVAAGFVAVAGALLVTRDAAPDRSAQLAGPAAAPAALSATGAADMVGADGRLIRSAELDRYLAAHRQYSNTSALAAPGGMVRNAAAAAPGR
jgi:sigma-E factor negative regulatory protein RseA